MTQTLQDVMTTSPACLEPSETLSTAAKVMRERDVGDIIVCEGDRITGIVTDRDIVVRAVAEGQDPRAVRLADVASTDMTTLPPDASIEEAVQMMREHAIRRLPVVDHGKPVGVVTLGDLAIERDSHSALADISAAPSNH